MAQYKKGITFGAFEILHAGHYNIIKKAKEQCEKLIVCLSSDEYIEKVKGHKTVISLKTRKIIIKAILGPEDRIDTQSIKQDKKKLVAKHRPDVIFVGSDWTPATFGGEGLGIPVIYIHRTPGISSTGLRKIIK